jgi:succinoglycan biosynthesis protein ExoU
LKSDREFARSAAKIDVLIAAWNRSDTIERTILSAIAEPSVHQVILIDDGSTDDTVTRARQCCPDPGRLRIHRLDSNCGPSCARNTALQIATAPWVAPLDADDFVLPGRFQALLSFADDWDFVGDDPLEIEADKVGKEEPRPVLFDHPFKPWPLDLRTFALGNIPRHGHLRKEFGYLKPLIRREFLSRHSLRYDERLRLGEDYAFYARALALGGRFLIVPSQGYISVIRPDSISAVHKKQDLEHLRDSDLELCTMKTLTSAERRALKKHFDSVDSKVQWLNMIEAFKSRRVVHFFAPLFHSPRISAFLVRQLLSEIFRRMRSRFEWRSSQVNAAFPNRNRVKDL